MSFLLGHVPLQVVITAVGIGHFLGGGSAFDEADELHGAEIEDVVRTLDKKRETLLQVDREDEPTEQREPSSSLEWPSRGEGMRSQPTKLFNCTVFLLSIGM